MKAFAVLAILATLALFAAPVSAQTICVKYATALNITQLDLVKAVVNRAVLGGSGNGVTVTGLVNLGATKNFFNGVVKYRAQGGPTNGLPTGAGIANLETPDFTTNTKAFTWLAEHLYAFFGSAGALGCNAPGFPTYQNIGSQYAIHRNMNITKTVFDAFNGQVAASATSFGVSAADVSAVGSVLGSFARSYNADGSIASNAICWGYDCACANGKTGATCNVANGASAASVSMLAMVAAALLALFAARV